MTSLSEDIMEASTGALAENRTETRLEESVDDAESLMMVLTGISTGIRKTEVLAAD